MMFLHKIQLGCVQVDRVLKEGHLAATTGRREAMSLPVSRLLLALVTL